MKFRVFARSSWFFFFIAHFTTGLRAFSVGLGGVEEAIDLAAEADKAAGLLIDPMLGPLLQGSDLVVLASAAGMVLPLIKADLGVE